MNELTKFLHAHIVGPNDTSKCSITHTKILSPTARYHIPDNLHEIFLKLYCNAFGKNSSIGITELPPENKVTPLRVDFDFRLDPTKYTIRKSPITLRLIKEVIKIYQLIIEEISDEPEPTAQEEQKICIYLKKEGGYRREDGVLKDGFHLHFPHFAVNSWVQDNTIRNRVMEKLAECQTFMGISWAKSSDNREENGVPYDKIVDKIANKSWLMYGSRKNTFSKPWLVAACYDSGLLEMGLEDVFDVEMRTFGSSDVPVSYFLPQLLSIRNECKEAPLISRYLRDGLNRLRSVRRKTVQHRSQEEAEKDLRMIEESGLVDMLSTRRAHDRNSWMDVGWCLYCIGDGSERTSEKALDMWIEFSRQDAAKFSEEVCIKEWSKMQHRGKTLWSLMKMAEEDSPEEYRRWRITIQEGIIETALHTPGKITDAAIAKLMHTMYEGQFVCSGHKAEEWHEFHNHRWHELDGAVTIRRKLLDDVGERFRVKAQRSLENAAESDIEKIRRKKLWDAVTKIETSTGMNSIVAYAKNMFYDENFNQKKDQADYLFGFENGVYDLDAGVFRPGRPDDYITMSCGHYYRDYAWDDAEVKEVEEFWRKVFTNPNLYDYFQDLACSCMKGGNQLKIFPIFTGGHDGGKSVTVDFVCRAFGIGGKGYAFIFPREFLQTKAMMGTSGGPRADMYQSKGKRWAFFPELSEEESLNVGLLKAITGGDANWCRTLYQSGGEIIAPKYVPTVQCNTPPKIPAHDPATWRRIRIIDFLSKFFVNPSDVPPTIEEQYQTRRFLADPDIRNNGKLDEMCEPWLWMLIERYKIYRRKRGISTPQEVLASTENYREDNDVYMQFIDEALERTTNKTDSITDVTVFAEFKGWYMDNYPLYYNREKPGKRKVRTELQKRIGDFVRKGTHVIWHGWKLKGEELLIQQDMLSTIPPPLSS